MNIEEVRKMLGMTGVTVSEERLEALAETMTDYRPKVDSLFDVDVDDVEAAGAFQPEWTGE
jgi:Asp-tRNA(Asn)/Glu-tRNA(Gln) amidotransferase C subunit